MASARLVFWARGHAYTYIQSAHSSIFGLKMLGSLQEPAIRKYSYWLTVNG